jgi:tetratricopeptide (TPR) repeat protein
VTRRIAMELRTCLTLLLIAWLPALGFARQGAPADPLEGVDLAPGLAEANALFESGLERWRAGDGRAAEALWLRALEIAGPAPPLSHRQDTVLDRWALCHNLGNAAFRDDRPLEAVGWYRAALRHRPRELDTLDNLLLAERAAELPDDDEVDFVRSLVGLLEMVNREEAPWLALLGLLPLGVILLAEALRGGSGWRLLSVLALLGALACLGPFLRYRLAAPGEAVMIVDEAGLERRREPLAERPVVGRWAPGTELRVVDRLAGWKRLEDASGERGWVSSEGLFDLDR